MKFSLAVVAALTGAASAQYANSTSVVTITSCVPTTILSTITITPPKPTTPVKPTTPAGTAPGTVSSTAVKPSSTGPISPTITPYKGAASNVAGSIAAVGMAAVAAIVMV